MKRLHTGVLLFDGIDIICISFSFGSGLAYLIRIYKKKTNVDPIVTELKKKSSRIVFSTNGTPLKAERVALVRGGERVRALSLAIRSKRLAALVRAILEVKRKQKLLKLFQINLVILNALLTSSVGLRFAVGVSLNYTQFILIAFPSTVGGFLMGQVIANPLASVFLPLAVLYGRGIEDIPDPYEKCKHMCKFAEEFHNKQLAIEMQNLNSLVEDMSTPLQLPFDEVPLICVEEKLSIVERYKLKSLIKSAKNKKRIQHFSEFIKKFPECDADPGAGYEEFVEKIIE